jgi:hypothetical protein
MWIMAPTVIARFSQFQKCGCAISRSITWIAGSAVTNRASGVLSGILLHQDYRAILLRNELSASDGHHHSNVGLDGVIYSDSVSNLLMYLGAESAVLSENPLKSLRIRADFDSTIRRFDASRPSQDSKR